MWEMYFSYNRKWRLQVEWSCSKMVWGDVTPHWFVVRLYFDHKQTLPNIAMFTGVLILLIFLKGPNVECVEKCFVALQVKDNGRLCTCLKHLWNNGTAVAKQRKPELRKSDQKTKNPFSHQIKDLQKVVTKISIPSVDI